MYHNDKVRNKPKNKSALLLIGLTPVVIEFAPPSHNAQVDDLRALLHVREENITSSKKDEDNDSTEVNEAVCCDTI